MSSTAQKPDATLFPHVIFEAPKFQVSAFGLAFRVIAAMRAAGLPESAIEDYKANVRGLDVEDAMLVTMYTVRVI